MRTAGGKAVCTDSKRFSACMAEQQSVRLCIATTNDRSKHQGWGCVGSAVLWLRPHTRSSGVGAVQCDCGGGPGAAVGICMCACWCRLPVAGQAGQCGHWQRQDRHRHCVRGVKLQLSQQAVHAVLATVEAAWLSAPPVGPGSARTQRAWRCAGMLWLLEAALWRWWIEVGGRWCG